MNIRKLSALFLVLVLLLCGCSAKGTVSDSGNAMSQEMAKGEEAPSVKTDTPLPDNRKLVQTVHMSVEVQELDSTVENMETRITEHGGYIENSSIYHGSPNSKYRSRNASLTVRIPADKLSAFLDQVSGLSNVISSSKTVEDVTLNYVATESRVNALKTEETRLLELLAQSKDMADLLAIESRLSDVRTELEQVTSTLKVYDNQVDYATVYMEVSEVKVYTDTEEKTVWQRIGTGFVKSLKGLWTGIVELFVFLIVALPYLVVIGGVAVAVIFILRRIKKAKRKAAASHSQKTE